MNQCFNPRHNSFQLLKSLVYVFVKWSSEGKQECLLNSFIEFMVSCEFLTAKVLVWEAKVLQISTVRSKTELTGDFEQDIACP